MNDTNEKISRLEKTLTELNETKSLLLEKSTFYEETTSRYQTLFKNSAAAFIEEDFTEACLLLKELPCNSREEYRKYLSDHYDLLEILIKSIRVLNVSDALLSMTEIYDREFFISSFTSFLLKESYDTFIDQFAILASGGDHYENETLGRKQNGEEFNVMLSVFFPHSDGSNVLVSMVEITDKVRLHRRQSRILADIRAGKKTADTLLQMTLDLSSRKNEKDILDTILKQVFETVPFDTANIMLLQNSRLVVVSHKGYEKYGSEEFMNKFSTKLADMGGAETFRGVSKVLIIEDTSLYPGWKYFPESAFIKSVLSLAIEWQGESIGLLTLDSERTGSFTREDAEKLKYLCQTAGITLQKSRLFKQAERDIEERLKAEKTLTRAISEKELLLKEIHHRVKNNLAIIVALINLQNSKISSSEEEAVFEELHQRVHAVALVHEKLYENHNIASIDFYSYVNDLINSVSLLSVNSGRINVSVNIGKEIYFDTDTLVPLGLIMNELFTNSYKYAFRDFPGSLSVSLSFKKGRFRLEVRDSGPGFTEGVLKGESSSLGLILVHTLAEQIRGTVQLKNDKGAVVMVSFPEGIL